MEVLVNGKPVQEYYHDGEYYIEGKEGTEFSLRFRNNTNRRAVFVPTIDGLSIMSGKLASFGESGYIISPHSSETIEGWRTSRSEIAKFFFSSVKESYAKSKGQPQNIGVIGCAVFEEKQKLYNPFVFDSQTITTSGSIGGSSISGMHTYTTASASNAIMRGTNSSVNLCASSAGIGTGFGEAKKSEVVTVSFDRESHPASIMTIYYNTRANLESMGVVLKKAHYVAPSAFPQEDDYCAPPKNWKR